ncbi:EcsC family protein [Heyndrickxia sporothermodurans]|uniref:EcsC family protein n=1 Tax=Bacillaceae TaxID=186817 RepID=UPI0010F656DC|nr:MULTISPECIES: EcsC family protein [Bacillaceae]MEB6551151.1 EcsC family protein [Heyndrickxia sporothermodurans]MED3781999.1 EcsC family protein [Heyndrickxia sporothermodurans]QTR71164.1 EcsC family protein [Bacillus cytotoxicus]HDR7314297.1 EcsC family protein [Bacillus cytotoxicus]
MSTTSLTESKMTKVLDWAYEKAVNGLPGTETAVELAQSYLNKHSSVEKAIDGLIRWQNAKGATSGFLTGLGGLITLPVTIPANVASVMYVQVRMIAAIAYMRGYDLKDDQVKTFVFVCLTGQAASDILKQAGMKLGTALAKEAIKKIPGEVIKAINKAVGIRLVTKFGQKGIVNLGKAVPLVGGIIGGAVDGIGTNTIGKTAKKVFS